MRISCEDASGQIDGERAVQSLSKLLASHAGKSPDAIAIAAPGRPPLTYAGLYRRIERVVGGLRVRGIGRHDRVALVLPNGGAMAVACLGVAAGAACAPLNPALRLREFDACLSDMDPKALICQAALDSPAAEAARRRGVPVIDLVPTARAEAGVFELSGVQEPPQAEKEMGKPGDIALLLYTSGTTSRPRKVALTHANICISARHMASNLALSPKDCCLNVMPLFHVHGLVGALLSSLSAGGSVVCTPGFDVLRFWKWMKAFRPTWYTASPTIHRAVADTAAAHLEVISRSPLRFIRSCSAPLPASVAKDLETLFSTPVLDAYGMTECAHQVTCNPLPPGERKAGSVGRPAGPEVAIMDDSGVMLPSGGVGEIVVRGDTVVADRDEPLAQGGPAFTRGWLRTGDQGFLDAEGYLFIKGRLKEIINRGAEKVAPMEVEEVLLAHPAVEEAVAFPVPHGSLGEDVAAAVVLHGGAAATERELRKFLLDRLADYKVPSQVAIVKEIPKGTTGKLQRLKLADGLAYCLKAKFVAPGDAVEARLAAIVAGLFGIETGGVGIQDNFFALGGDSLLAVRLVAQVRSVFRVELSVPNIFKDPTVGGQGQFIRDALELQQREYGHKNPGGLSLAEFPLKEPGGDAPTLGQHSIPRGGLKKRVPLSSSQERIWFLASLEPDAAAYNRPFAFRLQGPLQIPALEESLSEILRRHDILRAGFSEVDGKPIQTITPPYPIRLQLKDLTGSFPGEREAEARSFAGNEGRKPLDLEEGFVLRPTLIRLDQADHVLLLVSHHLVFDGWSQQVLLAELMQLYEAFATGKPSSLPELSVQFTDFARWERQKSRSERIERQLAYWKERLAGARLSTPLPTDRPRSSLRSGRGAHERFVLSTALSHALRNLGRRENATLFMVLSAALQLLLYRMTGENDVAVGVPTAGRDYAELEPLIGFFVNLHVLRTDLSGSSCFREVLERVREGALAMYANRDLPYAQLVAELQPERDPGRGSLFQLIFNANRSPGRNAELQGLSFEEFDFETGISVEDLSLEITEEGKELSCVFEYSTDLFDASTIRRTARYFTRLLESIVAHPDEPIRKLVFLTEIERRQLLFEWNDTRAAPPEGCIHSLFETQVERAPDAIALEWQDQQITYAELNSRSNQLARYLRAKYGVGPEVSVGVHMDCAPAMIVGLLGILKSGAFYVPLDPGLPKDRFNSMVEAAGVRLVLSQETAPASFGKSVAHWLSLDAEWPEVASESRGDAHSAALAENLAYVIYTSGSTGGPKGVQITRRGVTNFLNAMLRVLGLSARDRCLVSTSLSFDPSVLEIFLPLMTGARLVLAGRELRADPVEWSKMLARSGASFMQATPSAWRILTRVAWGHGQLKSLSGGEALPRQLAQLLKERCGTVWNGYGPTETSVYSAVYEVGSEGGPVPIGRPISNTQIYVLDPYLEPVPIGSVGELYIGGAGLSRGYLGEGALTAEKFIPHPFGAQPGSRLYATGDLARPTPHANLEFLGRRDRQMKIGGFRIEPGEIESVLGQHPGLREAVVTYRDDVPGGPCLVAYVIPGEVPPSMSALRGFLLNKLPYYMVPWDFVTLDALPLTPNGKLDYQVLPKPEPSLAQGDGAPGNSLERQLTQLWEKLLGREHIGLRDNFFRAGGHSLMAMRLLTEVEKLVGKPVAPQDFLQAPTIEELAALLRVRADARPQPVRTRPTLASNDAFWIGLKNRLLQALALYAPGIRSTRVFLHRLRGVQIGKNVSIGTGAIIETAYPKLVSIGDNAIIGIRSVIIAHFKETTDEAKASGKPSVRIEDDAYVGPGVIILPNVTIGCGSVVSAGSVVHGSVPPRTMVQGNPAAPVARCEVPLTRSNSYESFVSNLKPMED